MREACAQVLCDFQGRCVRRDRLAEWWAKMDDMFRNSSYLAGELWWMCPPRDDRGPCVLGMTAGHASYGHESYEWHCGHRHGYQLALAGVTRLGAVWSMR